MFTGIVEELGTVIENKGAGVLKIVAEKVMDDLKIGDSLAVNGICLTVRSISSKQITVDVMPETFRSTSLSKTRKGDKVNLERAVLNEGRFGGHIVTGHIDAVGMVVRRSTEKDAIWLGFKLPDTRYVVHKGSIAVDGVSLTVSRLENKIVWISLIPHTSKATTLSTKRPGDLLNIEFDILAKYNERPLGGRSENVTIESLRESGF